MKHVGHLAVLFIPLLHMHCSKSVPDITVAPQISSEISNVNGISYSGIIRVSSSHIKGGSSYLPDNRLPGGSSSSSGLIILGSSRGGSQVVDLVNMSSQKGVGVSSGGPNSQASSVSQSSTNIALPSSTTISSSVVSPSSNSISSSSAMSSSSQLVSSVTISSSSFVSSSQQNQPEDLILGVTYNEVGYITGSTLLDIGSGAYTNYANVTATALYDSGDKPSVVSNGGSCSISFAGDQNFLMRGGDEWTVQYLDILSTDSLKFWYKTTEPNIMVVISDSSENEYSVAISTLGPVDDSWSIAAIAVANISGLDLQKIKTLFGLQFDGVASIKVDEVRYGSFEKPSIPDFTVYDDTGVEFFDNPTLVTSVDQWGNPAVAFYRDTTESSSGSSALVLDLNNWGSEAYNAKVSFEVPSPTPDVLDLREYTGGTLEFSLLINQDDNGGYDLDSTTVVITYGHYSWQHVKYYSVPLSNYYGASDIGAWKDVVIPLADITSGVEGINLTGIGVPFSLEKMPSGVHIIDNIRYKALQ